LAFVNADLNNHVPPKKAPVRAETERIPGMDSGFEDMPEKKDTEGEPLYPKSLFLFQPLFTAHELNSLARMAQDAVPIPDGLNLDMDIVVNSGFGNVGDDDAESEVEKDAELDLGSGGGAGMDELRRVLREQEKKKKKLTPEEKAERAKVSSKVGDVLTVSQRKAARREKLKSDPYYLFDKDKDEVDVDDIPIVRLDDDEMEAAGKQLVATCMCTDFQKHRQRPKSRARRRDPPRLPQNSTAQARCPRAQLRPRPKPRSSSRAWRP
jgi:AP-3 complex subunit delta-1